MNKIVKLGFTKSKAYGLCGTSLMAALFSTAVVKADEVKSADSAPTVEAVAKSENLVVPETTEPVATTESVVDHTTEDKIAKAEVAKANVDKTEVEAGSEPVDTATLEPKTSTSVTKEGTEIKVENPDVHLEFPTGTDKYHGFKVEYRDVKIPDSIEINNGDSVKFTLPKEVSFQTNFDFDVTNKDNDVIGHAKTSIEDGTIKTVFNDYFKLHPMNKQISLTFDAIEISKEDENGSNLEYHIDKIEIANAVETISRDNQSKSRDIKTVKIYISGKTSKAAKDRQSIEKLVE